MLVVAQLVAEGVDLLFGRGRHEEIIKFEVVCSSGGRPRMIADVHG